jgi:hypothetical protein
MIDDLLLSLNFFNLSDFEFLLLCSGTNVEYLRQKAILFPLLRLIVVLSRFLVI